MGLRSAGDAAWVRMQEMHTKFLAGNPLGTRPLGKGEEAGTEL
jgi:hypothetical protein